MKASATVEPVTVSLADPPNAYLAESAQKRLEVLRGAMDMRLAALEAALADPAQGGSLEALILDLSRVATDEAQAAAASACVDARLDADVRIAKAQAGAQAAIVHERQVSTDLRRALEQSDERIATLSHEKVAEARQLRESLEGSLTEQRQTIGDLERLGPNSSARSRPPARTRCRTRAGGQSPPEPRSGRRTAHRVAAEGINRRQRTEEVSSDLARERERTADAQRAHADARSALEAERATAGDLRNRLDDIERRTSASTANEAKAGRRP